jgi:hypothetical protein
VNEKSSNAIINISEADFNKKIQLEGKTEGIKQ